MNRFATSLLLAATCFSALPARVLHADNYVIDPSHTSIIFGISHLGYSYTYGRFNKVSGAFTLDAANPANSQFQLAIDPASVDTNDAKRDDHLRGPDFFNAKQYPVISFQSTRVVPQQTAEGTTYQVTGDLNMHGVRKTVQLSLKKLGEGKGPYGNYRSGFLFQDSIKRSDFGMTEMIPMIGDEVAITISFEGLRQGPATGSGTVGASATAGSAPQQGSPGQGSGQQGSGQLGSGQQGSGSAGR